LLSAVAAAAVACVLLLAEASVLLVAVVVVVLAAVLRFLLALVACDRVLFLAACNAVGDFLRTLRTGTIGASVII
jgi:hypothetical protein